ncbi:DUF2884 family protein [Pseudoxanthomonas sp. CF125]|uniref:DUF2884 family protein n=1 Tax=Pseudoxanthomonas sp. CF125 TaxID=1855303 RepID=UPI00088A439F|nr:DUF2884 family protein [Pseudoxanthomonas sp. CF125]SDQ28690.1 Protein of unknown function [Pseudoxanthomonas sp. CF125]
MKTTHFSSLLALSLAVLVAGCTPGTHVSTDKGNVSSNGKVITLRANGQPDAKISADGELTIDGKAVAMNDTQRALLQTYLKEMNAMTADGIAIGKQGAALAGTAVSEAIKGAIKGDGDQVDAKVEAEAKKIEQQAMQLCKRLVTIKASQDALAEQLPAFKPYATIDATDVDDCGSKGGDSYAAGKEAGGSLARAMKGEKDQAAAAGETVAEAEPTAESNASKQ